jgi:class 3 adenylate cyclase/predicted ATPase
LAEQSRQTQQTQAIDLDKVRAAIAGLEAQRALLGDAVVGPALVALRQQLASTEHEAFAPSTDPQPLPLEERRIVTVFFSDIVNSTAIAEHMDPEDWREVVAEVQAFIGNLILKHDGMILHYLGDGLLAIFGAQVAAEQDAEKAIRAALEIQAGMASRQGKPHIQLRIGVHTGLVVLGEIGTSGRSEYTATGDAMNLAARLQTAAPPGSVLISHDTYHHVRGLFDVSPQPMLALKGKAEPVQTYLVRHQAQQTFTSPSRGVAGVTPHTIGREAELAQLHHAMSHALSAGDIVWTQLIGEPGMGKTRLLDEVRQYVESLAQPILLLKARAYAGDEKMAFALARRFWFDRFQIAEDAPLSEAEARWQEQFLTLQGADEEGAHALGLLIGFPFDASPHIGAMRHDPVQVKGRAYVVSQHVLDTIRSRIPIVVLLEDLQWADQSSLDYLVHVIMQGRQMPGGGGLFVLATARPEWLPPTALSEHASYQPISVQPLSAALCRDLTQELLRRAEGMPDDVIDMIVQRAEGVPYYVEEMVNWLLDHGVLDASTIPWRFVAERLNATPLPTSLQHLLQTRLGMLRENERVILQHGAVIGRKFWEGALNAVGVGASAVVLSDLHTRGLVDREVESTFADDHEWMFHHNLFYEVTYESVLKRERRRLHKATAVWLETQVRQAGRLNEFVGLIGEHAERAGDTSAAADWFLQAGAQAQARGATVEARKYYERVLRLIEHTDHERHWHALLSHSDVLRVLGERADYERVVTELLALAEQFGDRHRAEAHYRHGYYLDSTGEYRAALQAYHRAVQAAKSVELHSLAATLLALIAVSRNRLGDAEGALQAAQEAAEYARQAGESASVRALNNLAVYYVESGDLARAAQLHQEQAIINHRLGDRAVEANALANLGYDLVCLGEYEQARMALEQSLALSQSIGARRELAYSQLNLALAHWRLGQSEAAMRVLNQLERELGNMGDTFARAAGLSYRGLVLEQTGQFEGALASFNEAAAVLEQLGVRGYALDARAGMARCEIALGHVNEARQLMPSVLAHVREYGATGMEFPLWAFLTCTDLLSLEGQADAAIALIDEGYRELMRRAERISDPQWREHFLLRVPEHAALIERHSRFATVQPMANDG